MQQIKRLWILGIVFIILLSSTNAITTNSTKYKTNFYYSGNGNLVTNTYFVGSGVGQKMIGNRTGTNYKEEVGIFYTATGSVSTITTTTTPTTTTTSTTVPKQFYIQNETGSKKHFFDSVGDFFHNGSGDIKGNLNLTGNLNIFGCIRYNFSGSLVTLGVCV